MAHKNSSLTDSSPQTDVYPLKNCIITNAFTLYSDISNGIKVIGVNLRTAKLGNARLYS